MAAATSTLKHKYYVYVINYLMHCSGLELYHGSRHRFFMLLSSTQISSLEEEQRVYVMHNCKNI